MLFCRNYHCCSRDAHPAVELIVTWIFQRGDLHSCLKQCHLFFIHGVDVRTIACMLAVLVLEGYSNKVSKEVLTSLHFMMPLGTYSGNLSKASEATDALSPSHGHCAALLLSCNLWAHTDLTSCSCSVDLKIMGYTKHSIVYTICTSNWSIKILSA